MLKQSKATLVGNFTDLVSSKVKEYGSIYLLFFCDNDCTDCTLHLTYYKLNIHKSNQVVIIWKQVCFFFTTEYFISFGNMSYQSLSFTHLLASSPNSHIHSYPFPEKFPGKLFRKTREVTQVSHPHQSRTSHGSSLYP